MEGMPYRGAQYFRRISVAEDEIVLGGHEQAS